jgi:hypothetical protein
MTWFGKIVEEMRDNGELIEDQHEYNQALEYIMNNPEEFENSFKDCGTVNSYEARELGDYHRYLTHINKVSGKEFKSYVRLISKSSAVVYNRCPDLGDWESYTLVSFPAELQAKMGLAA